MFGLAAGVRAATAVAGVVGLAVLFPSTDGWPASDEFDGRLYANPETGCLELPPDDWNAPEIMPVDPMPSPRADYGSREDVRRRLEELRGPVREGGARVHAEPWPACNKPPSAARGRTDTGADR